jgi:hypothetical protein
MRVLAIDPGPTESAYVLWDQDFILDSGERPNDDMRYMLRNMDVQESDHCAIETITSYGMPVGQEVFETCIWIGRFQECWNRRSAQPVLLIPRSVVKIHHCHSSKAKDANVRQALIDKFGKPGTKKRRGITYGISGHMWSAFAIATCMADIVERCSCQDLSSEHKKEVTL